MNNNITQTDKGFYVENTTARFDVEEIIAKIANADEIEIMEFDFDDCFTALREMEYSLKSIANSTCCGDCQEASRVAKKTLGLV